MGYVHITKNSISISVTTVSLLSVLCLFYISHKSQFKLTNILKQIHKITILFIIAFIAGHFISLDIIIKTFSYLILTTDLLIDTFY